MESDQNSSLVTLFKGSSIIFVGRVLGLGISFITVVIIARSYGPERYGAIALGVTLLTFLSTLALIGLPEGITRYLARYTNPAKRRGVIVSGLQLGIPAAIVTSTLVVVFAEPLAVHAFDDRNLITIFRIFGITIPMAAVTHLAIATSRGNKESLPVIFLETGVLGLSLLMFVTVAIVLEGEIISVALAYFTAYTLACLIALYYLRQQFSVLSGIGTDTIHKELLVFSLPLLISGTMGRILEQFDTFFLGVFASTSAIGVYRAIYPISSLLFIVLASMEFILMPLLSEEHAANEFDSMNHIYLVATKWGFIFIFPLFLLLTVFTQEIIGMTFGTEYVEGRFALIILAFGFMTQVLLGPNSTALVAIGESRVIMYITLFSAGMNFVLNLILIPQYSYLGAAVATATSYGIMNIMFSVRLAKSTTIQPLTRHYVSTIGISTGFLLIAFLTKMYLPWHRYVIFAIVLVILTIYPFVVVFAVGIQEIEAELLVDFENQTGIDIKGIKQMLERFK